MYTNQSGDSTIYSAHIENNSLLVSLRSGVDENNLNPSDTEPKSSDRCAGYHGCTAERSDLFYDIQTVQEADQTS